VTGSVSAKLPPEGDHRSTRHQQLINAAISSIAEHGLAHTTVARVAEAAGLSAKSLELTRIPENLVQTSAEDARKNLKLMELLEDNDDVQDVFSNFDISDELMEAVSDTLQV